MLIVIQRINNWCSELIQGLKINYAANFLVNPSATFPASFSGKVLRKQQLQIAAPGIWIEWQSELADGHSDCKGLISTAQFSLSTQWKWPVRRPNSLYSATIRVKLEKCSFQSWAGEVPNLSLIPASLSIPIFLAFTGPVRFCCRAKNQYTVPGVIVERLRATWIQQRIATRSRPPPSNMLGRSRCKWKSTLANNRRGCGAAVTHCGGTHPTTESRNTIGTFCSLSPATSPASEQRHVGNWGESWCLEGFPL